MFGGNYPPVQAPFFQPSTPPPLFPVLNNITPPPVQPKPMPVKQEPTEMKPPEIKPPEPGLLQVPNTTTSLGKRAPRPSPLRQSHSAPQDSSIQPSVGTPPHSAKKPPNLRVEIPHESKERRPNQPPDQPNPEENVEQSPEAEEKDEAFETKSTSSSSSSDDNIPSISSIAGHQVSPMNGALMPENIAFSAYSAVFPRNLPSPSTFYNEFYQMGANNAITGVAGEMASPLNFTPIAGTPNAFAWPSFRLPGLATNYVGKETKRTEENADSGTEAPDSKKQKTS